MSNAAYSLQGHTDRERLSYMLNTLGSAALWLCAGVAARVVSRHFSKKH